MNKTLQTPNWEPIYSQLLFRSEDFLEISILPPDAMTFEDLQDARREIINQHDIKYFSPTDNQRLLRKKRFPFS